MVEGVLFGSTDYGKVPCPNDKSHGYLELEREDTDKGFGGRFLRRYWWGQFMCYVCGACVTLSVEQLVPVEGL